MTDLLLLIPTLPMLAVLIWAVLHIRKGRATHGRHMTAIRSGRSLRVHLKRNTPTDEDRKVA